MDLTAVWTVLGVFVAAILGALSLLVPVLLAAIASQRKEIARLERERTDYLLRLTEAQNDRRQAEHDQREAEQAIANLRATEEVRQAKGGRR